MCMRPMFPVADHDEDDRDVALLVVAEWIVGQLPKKK